MSENLLSPLHIQKLGHPIEEIRLRALSSIISKYNLNLVDECNLENTKLLFDKLLNWFNFEQYTEEEKVLRLILKILKYKNADLILRELDRKKLLKRVKEIEKKIDFEYSAVIQEIIHLITKIETNIGDNAIQHHNVGCDRVDYLNEKNSGNIYDLQEDFICSKSNSKHSEVAENSNVESECIKKTIYKVEYFPWQHLIPGDKHILSSVYDGLRYIDNKSSILQSCQFFNEVLLRDFPVEVFIQRPLVIKTFLRLLECTEINIRLSIINCLKKLVKCLKESIRSALNMSLFNRKKEYYTTLVFPIMSDDSSDSSSFLENFQLNLASFEEDFKFENIEPDMKKYQISVPEFCFETCFQILPLLMKNQSLEETISLLDLSFEVLNCLLFNLKSSIWTNSDVKNKFSKIFGKLYELLKFYKGKCQIYIILLYVTINLLNSLKPPSGYEVSEILVGGLQSELGSCLSNFILVLLFPQLHSVILNYVEQLPGRREKEAVLDHKESLMVLESMKSAVSFLKSYNKLKTRLEKLECMSNALLSLDFHQNVRLIQLFVSSCLVKWRKCQLKEEEFKLRQKILIKLLAHCNVFVKKSTYMEVKELAENLLGVEAKAPLFDCPGEKMDFLFDEEVLTEIICHGLSSSLAEVRKCSREIIMFLLKSKYLMPEVSWRDFIKALIPCLALLHCYADKSTSLGRCIVKMLDPDIAESIGLPLIEVLKGNLRLLYSKNNLTREEAISRLFWLLSKEDSSSEKLPRISVLTGMNLSGICSCVKPKEFTKIRQSFYSQGRMCDVLDMLNAETVEPNLRRSALSQICVMMDDFHLHSTFLEQKGLSTILQILENCLVEKGYQNYPDCAIPIIDILKNLALHNACVRQELSSQINVLYSVLRSLFLFSNDDVLRQNAVELLCLLLYSECILRAPSELSFKCSLSFPEIVVDKMCLPFAPYVHWKNSRHLEPSIRKVILTKENCSKLIRTYWAIQWVGSISEVLATAKSDIEEKVHSPGIPDEMKLLHEDVESLKSCAFGVSVKQILYSIQNATTHEAVVSSLYNLHCYFLLYNVNKFTNGKKSNDVGSDTSLSHMLWESTLERFMTATPSCNQDEILLLRVVRFVQLILKSFKSERLINWVGKLLLDSNQPIPRLLKNIGTERIGLAGKELRLSIIELSQTIVTLSGTLDKNKWFYYIELVCSHLKLDRTHEFYNVAFIDWLLSLLTHLTGKWNWDFEGKTRFLEKLIIRITEIVIAFHCTKDSVVSFMGINILRNSLLILNQILGATQANLKEWEKLWHESFCKVVGQKESPNYCWLLSLWFIRDPVTRAAAYQLFVGFSATSVSSDLLIDRLGIQFEHIWNHGFKVLFDSRECNLVKEKVALLLSNLTVQGSTITCGNFLQHLESINFYQEVCKIISNCICEHTLSYVTVHKTFSNFAGEPVTTPSFVTTVCKFLMSLLPIKPDEVVKQMVESGVIESLTRLLGDIPESARICGKHDQSLDVLHMYINICKLLTRSILANCSGHSSTLQSQQSISCLLAMINYNLYCEGSHTITDIKYELWTDIFDCFSAMLTDNPKNSSDSKNESLGFMLFNRALTENGTDDFISSLYIAVTSDSMNLRCSVFHFLINLFCHERNTQSRVTICDVFDRKISAQALKLTMKQGWKALKISEKLTGNFGVRLADVLSQIFQLSTTCCVQACKMTIVKCLGSLLAVCKTAQNFCVDLGLPDSIVSMLKQICAKLNLETVDSLKKLSSRKKLSPLLSDLESLFQLITNLMYDNEKAKVAVADCALSGVVHKLWPWCNAQQSLLVITLKMLCTFTRSSNHACRTLVLSGGLGVLGLKKSPGSLTLMNSVINQVTSEMDLTSYDHDFQNLCLCLQLLSNSCRVAECRSVISKGNFLLRFTKLHPNKKKRALGDSVVESWLKFLAAFSAYQEGQLNLCKSEEILDLLITMAASVKSSHRLEALNILRNICLNQLNRVRMLGCCPFLALLFNTLDSEKSGEVQVAAVMIWALSSNSQKAKLILRSSGFESKLMSTQRRCVLKEDVETAELIDSVLDILKNK